jgi:membrane protein implicated in regulation of membrane protease activity
MINAWTFWLLLAFGFFLLEALVPGLFFFLSFACGSFVASQIAWSIPGASLWIVCTAALLASLVTFILLSKIVRAQKFSVSQQKHAPTNVDALQGVTVITKTFIATGAIGLVKLEGEIWSAKNIGPEMQVGDVATVMYVEGNKLIIKK